MYVHSINCSLVFFLISNNLINIHEYNSIDNFHIGPLSKGATFVCISIKLVPRLLV